jgi:hypothetical protein
MEVDYLAGRCTRPDSILQAAFGREVEHALTFQILAASLQAHPKGPVPAHG